MNQIDNSDFQEKQESEYELNEHKNNKIQNSDKFDSKMSQIE